MSENDILPLSSSEIVYNAAECLACGDIIESLHVHDYNTCKCGRCAVDGGTRYLKRTANDFKEMRELSVYANEPFEKVRQFAYRLGRGKKGDEPLTKTLIKDMNHEYLAASIEYLKDRQSSIEFRILIQERQFRIDNNL